MEIGFFLDNTSGYPSRGLYGHMRVLGLGKLTSLETVEGSYPTIAMNLHWTYEKLCCKEELFWFYS